MKIEKNLRLLGEFAHLKKGWNGYDADPIDKQVIENAKAIILRLPVQPEVFPTANNSVQLEYELDDGDYLEFEVFRDHINEFRKKEKTSRDIHEIDEVIKTVESLILP